MDIVQAYFESKLSPIHVPQLTDRPSRLGPSGRAQRSSPTFMRCNGHNQPKADGQISPKRPFKFGHHSVSLEPAKAAVRNFSGAKQEQ
jgi:hypothetical protein